MTNKFCRFLSNGCSINLETKLTVRPCCWYGQSIPLADRLKDNPFNLITDWTPECNACYQQEQAGMHSFRQASFDIIPEQEDSSPVALDVNIDFNCNAACVMCNSEYSTLWAKQMDRHAIIHIKPSNDHQQYIDQILALDLTSVRRIKFFGGEPLLTDTHLQILKKIPYPEQCDIWYTTNASVLPNDNVLDIWSKFKLVYIEASIDGIENQFEYIRWPLPWSLIERNLQVLKEKAPTNVLFRINHTLNPFNVYYYNKLEQWVSNEFSANRLGDPTEINIHPCWGDWALSRTPELLRQVIYEKYPNHIVSNLLKTSDIQSYDTVESFTNQWDPIRKNNWRLVFPEIVKYFS